MALGFTTKNVDFSNPLSSGAASLNISSLVTKGSLVNIDTNETYKFLFNPTTIKSSGMRAVYDEKNVAFRSHPKLQYKHTTGKEWTFQLYLNAASSGAQSLISVIPTSRNLNDDTAFLESLVYPLDNKGIENRRPPKIRFVWSKIANVKVVVLEIGTVYQKFNFRLQQQVTLVDVTLKEDPETSVTSNLVRERGSMGRPGLLGSLLDELPTGVGSSLDSITSYI